MTKPTALPTQRKPLAQAVSELWPGARYIALGIILLWSFLLTDMSAYFSGSETSSEIAVKANYFLLGASVVTYGVVLALHKQLEPIFSSKKLSYGIAAVGFVGALLVVISGPGFLRDILKSTWIFPLGNILCGIAIPVLTIQCGLTYAELKKSRVLRYLLLSELTVVVLFYCIVGASWLHPIPGAQALSEIVALLLLPFVTAWCLSVPKGVSPTADIDGAGNATANASGDTSSAEPAVRYSQVRSLPFSLWKFFITLLVFSFAAAVASGFTSSAQLPEDYQTSAQAVILLRALVVALLIVISVKSAIHVRMEAAFIAAMAVIAVLVAILPFVGNATTAVAIVTGLFTNVFHLIVWCLVSFMAGARTCNPLLAFTLGGLFSRGGMFFGLLYGSAGAEAAAAFSNSMIPHLLIVILSFGCILLIATEQDFHMLLGFTPTEKMALKVFAKREEPAGKECKKERDGKWKTAVKQVGDRARLTNRELEIFEQLSFGHQLEDIAEYLSISLNTVRTHSKNIYGKLGVHSRKELVDLVKAEIAENESGR